MTNHAHLLVTTQNETGIAKLMQSIGRRYVQYINRAYRRTGSLWEGRYKSSVIQAESYLLTCMRYIELNPVRATMVQDPGQYHWSSYRHNGLGQADSRITPHPVFLALDRSGPWMRNRLPTFGLLCHRGSRWGRGVSVSRFVRQR